MCGPLTNYTVRPDDWSPCKAAAVILAHRLTQRYIKRKVCHRPERVQVSPFSVLSLKLLMKKVTLQTF